MPKDTFDFPPSAAVDSAAPDRAPAWTPAMALHCLSANLAAIQDRALALDADGVFPERDVALLHHLGALRVFAAGGSAPREMVDALRLVGRANLSLGRIFEGHINGAQLVRRYGDGAQRRQLAEDLERGRLYGVWNTGPESGVEIVAGGEGAVLSGRKSFATGAGHIDRAVITATNRDGGRQMVIVDAACPSRTDASGWRMRGMKATLSGEYDLSGLPADDGALLGAPGDYLLEPTFSAGAWRFTAVQLGGVERIVQLLRQSLIAGGSCAEPVRRARFAHAVSAMRSAYLWVGEAAERAEAPAAGDDAIAVVLMARGVVEDAGLQVMEAAARCVGTRAFRTDNALDLACRDLSLYLRQPVPDEARDRAAQTFLDHDAWSDDRLW